MQIKYWKEILGMSIVRQNDSTVLLSYNEGRFGIQFAQIKDPIDRAEAFGRIAFAGNNTDFIMFSLQLNFFS